MKQVKVTVRLPECIVDCLSKAYDAPPATALRMFIIDVLTGRIESTSLPDECTRCIERLPWPKPG